MLILTELVRSAPIRISLSQQKVLQEIFQASFQPAEDGMVVITPGSRVGSANLGDLTVLVKPKLPVTRILEMISEAADPYRWLNLEVEGVSHSNLEDALAALFVQACTKTFEKGIYRSYRRERQRLSFVRGKILTGPTFRSATPIPITVESDVFDDDTLENQVLLAALQRIRSYSGTTAITRRNAHHAWRNVSHVTQLRNPLESARSIVWTRHNHWYQHAVYLAELVLNARSIDQSLGNASIPGFVINMPLVVEQWVRSLLRRSWALDTAQMPDSWKGKLWLDSSRRVELQPDLAVKVLGRWRFVGDVKYKDLSKGGPRRDDVYQMLAYLTATGLTQGVLIYAGASGRDETLTIPNTGASIHVISVDLSAGRPADELRRKIDSLPNLLLQEISKAF